jgi:ABC-type sulfate/molybdate transport systems ATPase subunit/ABC-type sulfate transport system permease component
VIAPAARRGPATAPLSWLGGLLVAYLCVPLAAFLVRLAASHQRGFAQPGLWGALRTSVESATISTTLVVLTGIPLAHWLAGRRSAARSAVGLAVQLPLALPPVMAGVVLLYLVGPYTALGRLTAQHLTGTLAGIVVAQTFVAGPFLVVAARSAFAAIDPSLDDLGATLGLAPTTRFARIALPVAAPGIRAGVLLCWLRAFGEYGATVLIAYHPYSLPVYTSVQFGGAGIPDTQAPTVLAVAAAAVAVTVSRLHLPRRRPAPLPDGAPPSPAVPRPAPVAFDLDFTVGDFHLTAAHRASTPRLAVLGPSGSGKSMTLRAIAGLLGTGVGSVEVGGREVGGLPAERRHLGYVPQGQVLLPHRTVWEQLTMAPDADPATAAWWLQTLGMDGLAGRLPAELSGGQRQRVGLALAMSRRPEVVLLDEPFSALDSPVRDALRVELRHLQRRTGLSTVLVTHDPEEAALLADDLVVVAGGRVLQAGSVADLHARPCSPEVAGLLGVANIVGGVVAGPGVIAAGALRLGADTGHLAPGAPIRWCVRAGHLRLIAGDGCATVLDAVETGPHLVVEVAVDQGPVLRLHLTGGGLWSAGTRCTPVADPGAITVWPDPPGR